MVLRFTAQIRVIAGPLWLGERSRRAFSAPVPVSVNDPHRNPAGIAERDPNNQPRKAATSSIMVMCSTKLSGQHHASAYPSEGC
jgi:hypothetical protein